MQLHFSRWVQNFAIAIFSLAMLCSLTAQPASAGTATATLTVTASIASTCTINAATLAFGAYDPVVVNKTVNLDQITTIGFTCTLGSTGTIDIDKGANSTGTTPNFQRRLTDGATPTAHFLNYNLYQDAAHTTLWGTTTSGTAEANAGLGVAQTTNLYGRIPSGQNGTNGSYTDSATMTITF